MSEGSAKKSFFKALAERLAGGAEAPPKRRIFICGGPTCCSPDAGRASLEHAKRRLAELGLESGAARVECSKAACMNVCGQGPIAYVLPEKTWYLEMRGPRLDRVIERHLRDGNPVAEHTFDPPPDARRPG